ncbi:MAG: hypothetical protein NTU63_02215 [Candidatus Pacearchaeota archaeon]|nr:hypothetical protein [Candidatus Pacearchaeota archaeon]
MSFNETKNIKASLILEVIGFPPEHLTETLETLIKQIGEEKGVKILEKKMNPPVLIKEQKNFYSSFAEIIVEVEDILSIAILLFKYMPCHVEIISPQSITLPNTEWSDIFSELARRLHGYEEIVRIMQSESNILQKKLKGLMNKSELNNPEDAEGKSSEEDIPENTENNPEEKIETEKNQEEEIKKEEEKEK